MKNNKAFTLIELLIVIAITILMSVIVFSNYGKNNEIFALERSSQKLVQDFRTAQDMAMSGDGGSSTTLGYGIYVATASPTSYLLYMEVADTPPHMYYEAGVDTIVQTISIEKGIKICALRDGGSVATRSISFEPPNPITYIGAAASGHTVEIDLCITSDTTKIRTITVNNAGMVQITK